MKLHAILIATLTLTIIGCGQSREEQLIGKWAHEIRPNETLEFFDDGTLAVSTGQLPEGSKWSITKDGRLKLDDPQLDIVVAADFIFEGPDKMTLTIPEGSGTDIKLVRVK